MDANLLNPIVFIGGIHGAGKTHISRQLATLLPALQVTAGDLIKETIGQTHAVTHGPRDKAVANVDANQTALLRGLDSYRARSRPGPILLDGHFSLLQSDGTVTEIPVSVFEKIGPTAVLLIETSIDLIYHRLKNRDGATPEMSTISSLVERERAGAEAVCAYLRIPMWTVRGDIETEDAVATAASHLRPILAGAS